MKKIPSSALLPLIVALVLTTISGSVYSGYWYYRLKLETVSLRVLPKGDATWGILQLNNEELKFSNAVLSVGNNNSPETRKNLSFRLDILYSRIDVITEVFDRFGIWVSANSASGVYPVGIEFNNHLENELQKIQQDFAHLDRIVQAFLNSPDPDRLPEIERQIKLLITQSSELASEFNQVTSQTEYNLRENVLSQTEQFQNALLTVILGFVFFSAIVLILFINARKAEKISGQIAKDLQIANSVKSEFLSSMSHELRTPLNSILGFSQLLETDTDFPLNEDQKESTSHITKAGRYLLQLIDEVLELSKIEAGILSLDFGDVSARSIIDESLGFVRGRAKTQGIEIRDLTIGHELPWLWTDQIRVQQALLNLLSNAIKYNSENGTVTLEHQKLSDKMLRFSVTDTGDGIPVEKQKDIYKPFERLGREAGEIEGTGIGLNITRQIVNRLGGKVGFKSEEGQGSTFWIDVPISSSEVVNKTKTKSAKNIPREVDLKNSDSPVRTILYVEDNHANLKLLEKIVSRLENIKLLTAVNAELGLAIVEKEEPDLILMDINLPGMSGTEALAQLKLSDKSSAIPVVAVSASAMAEDIKKAMKAGFNEYLTKPLDIAKLNQIIRTSLADSPGPE